MMWIISVYAACIPWELTLRALLRAHPGSQFWVYLLYNTYLNNSESCYPSAQLIECSSFVDFFYIQCKCFTHVVERMCEKGKTGCYFFEGSVVPSIRPIGSEIELLSGHIETFCAVHSIIRRAYPFCNLRITTCVNMSESVCTDVSMLSIF